MQHKNNNERNRPDEGPAHSPLGPSSAKRRLKCLASYEEEKAWAIINPVPPKDSPDAIDGTKAHSILEVWINSGKVAARKLAMDLFKCSESKLEEHLNNIAVAVDYVDHFRAQGYKVWTEQRFEMTDVHEECFGTGDITMYHEGLGHLIIADFKYGQGVRVDIEDIYDSATLGGVNPQITLYAHGAIRFLTKLLGREIPLKKVTGVIIQPRYAGSEPITEVHLDPITIEMEIDEIREAFKAATSDGPKPYVTGDHCRWCTAQTECKKQRSQVQDVLNQSLILMAGGEASPIATAAFKPEGIDFKKLRELYDKKKEVEQFFKKLSSLMYNLVESGQGEKVGLGFVSGRVTRAYPEEVLNSDEPSRELALALQSADPELKINPNLLVEDSVIPHSRVASHLADIYGKAKVQKALDKILVKKQGEKRLGDLSEADLSLSRNVDDLFGT